MPCGPHAVRSQTFSTYEAPHKLVITHVPTKSERGMPKNVKLQEIYELTEHNGVTTVRQTISIEQTGINILWRILIWIVSRTGKPTGSTYMQNLRDLVETGKIPPSKA